MFGFGKKKLNQRTSEDLDFSDFDEFDFNDLDGEDNTRNATLTSRLKSDVRDELDYKRQDAQFRRELLKQSLPADYTPLLESYDTVSNEVGKLYRDQQKEWQKIRKDVKTAVLPFGELASKLGFKKLQAWAEEPERTSAGEPDQDQLDELKIHSILQDTFGQFAASQAQTAAVKQESDDERYAEDKADRVQSAERQQQGNEILAGINKGIAAQRSFNEQITYAYQRKSIEMQARTLITAQRQLQTLTAYRQESMAELQAIHKNTGLPDYLKINASEIAQQVLTQKVMSGIMAPFDGVGGKLTSRVLSKIRDKMTNFWEFAGQGLSMLNDNNRDTTEAGGSVLGQYGDMLRSTVIGSGVDKGLKKVTGYITPKIRAEMERRGWDKYGNNFSSLSAQLPMLANKGLKQGFNNKLLDGIVDFFGLRDAAITGDRTAFNSRDLDLEKAAFMDNRLKLTLMEVIPGWLKKIYMNTYKTAFRKESDDLVWDFKSGSFVKSKEVNDAAMDKIVKKENIINSVEAVETWLRALDPNGVMTEKTRNWVKRWVLKERAGSDAMHPLELLSPTVSAPQDVKGELLFIIPILLNLTEKEKEEIMNADGVTDIMMMSLKGNRKYNDKMRSLSDASVKIRSTSVLDEKEIEKQAKTAEGRQFLLKAGIIIPSPDGESYFINPEFEHKAFGTYGSKYKRNGQVTLDDGQLSVEAIDDDYDHTNEKVSLRNRLNYGSMHKSAAQKAHDRLSRIGRMNRGDLAFDDLMLGDDYILDPTTGELISSEDSRFAAIKERIEGTKKFNRLSMSQMHKLSPLGVRRLMNNKASSIAQQQIFGRRTFASGGQIPSFAKAGEIKPGVQNGEPDQEQVVKTHGGEMVVNKDATDFNKSLLNAINKLGAPLINSDNTINSVYYKLFGFKSEKEFKAGAKGKGLTSKAKEFANEQKETAIKKIWENLDITGGKLTRSEMNSVLDVKLNVDRRLSNAMKLWTKQQRDQARADPKAYANRLGKMGMNTLHKKFTDFIDPDGDGTNLEILSQLGRIGSKVGGDALSSVRGLGYGAFGATRNAVTNTKGKLLDRDRTMMAVTSTLAEVENPKMFNLPIDLYLKGKGTPFVTKKGFNDHLYVDQNTGAIIKNPSEITGTIVTNDGENSVIATLADMLGGVVTRAQKPYRLLGLEESNRHYQSATEYAGKRYAILAQSEKFKDYMEKGKQLRDKFVLDQPIDIYTRDKKLLLTAQGFKERRYVDQQTGNVLWSHHDITGPVIDTQDNRNIVLTQANLDDGLFDNEGEHVKISKIKQYRNMAFKRTSEVYNQYAAKHVNKVRDKALNWMSAMGEKRVGLNYDDNPIDVYVVGETTPRVTAVEFKAGKVFCQDKPIKSHSGIKGAVTMMNEHGMYVKIAVEDFPNLCDAMGNKLQLPLMMSATQRFGAYLKEAALPSAKLKSLTSYLRMSKDKRKELMDDKIKKMGIAFDVYLKGAPDKPILDKKGFENNQYISAKTGKPIIIPEYIDGPVMDTGGQIIVSEDDLKKGLETFDGKKVNIGFDPINGGLINNLRSSFNISRRVAAEVSNLQITNIEDVYIKGEKDPILKALDIKAKKYFRADNGKPVEDYADVLAGVKDKDGNTIISEKDLKTGLVTANGKSISTLSKVKGALKRFTNLFRKGSWQDQRDGKPKEKEDGKKDGDKKEKKDSWMKKLVKFFMVPLGTMFGSLTMGIKEIFGGGISWLGKTLAAKMAGSALGGMLGGLGGAGGRGAGGLLSKLGWRGKLAAGALAGAGLYSGYKYLDGNENSPEAAMDAGDQAILDGQKNSAHVDNDPTMAAIQAGKDPNAPPEEESFLSKYGTTAALGAAALFPFQTAKLAWKGVKGFSKGVGWAGRQGLRGAAWGAGKLAGKAPGVGRFAAGAARLAGRAGLGALSGASGLMRGGFALGRILFTSARLLTPWGLALTAAWYLGKAGMKLWNNHKNPWNRFRLAQYGFNHNDSDVMDKIAKIETVAASLLTISANGVGMKNDEKAMTEILKICGFKDEQGQDIPEEQERIPMFAMWFKERFMRVFASYAEGLKKITGKPDMIDLQTLDRDQQERLLKGVHFVSAQDTPYTIMQSPFRDPSSCEMDFNDVDKISRKLRDKISQLPKPEKKAATKTAEDGLDKKHETNKAGKSDADKAVEKEMNNDAIVTQAKKDVGDPKNMTDAAVKAVKYNSVATQAIAKQHQKAMIKTTEESAKQTDSLFDKLYTNLSARLENFTNKAKSVYQQFSEGDVSGGLASAGSMALDAAENIPGIGIGVKVGRELASQISDYVTGDSKQLQMGIYKAFLNAGLSDNQARILTAEVGRENSYRAKVVYHSHIDPANGKPNLGMISWQGDRGMKLFKFLESKGLIDKNMKMKEGQATLNAQAEFAVNEIKSNGAYKETLNKFLNNPNVDYNTAVRVLGKNYIRWRFDDQKYASGHRNRDQFYNQLNQQLSNMGKGAQSPTAGVQPQGGGSGSGTPLLIAAGKGVAATPTQSQTAAGGIMGGAMANLDAKYGNKTPATNQPASLTKTPTPQIATTPAKQAATAVTTAKVTGQADWDLDAVVAKVAARAGTKSQGKCAAYVREALQAGDLKKQIKGGLGHAFEYMKSLPPLGFVPVGNINSVKPQKGDICVFPRYGNNPSGGAAYGHVCIYTGSQWISDFVQRTMFPNSNNQSLPHTIFRAQRGITKSGPVTAKAMPDGSGVDDRQARPTSVANGFNIGNPGTPSKVNQSMNSISSGSMSTTNVGSQQYVQEQPQAMNLGETNVILNKQLKVQEEMLGILKQLVTGQVSAVNNRNNPNQPQATQGITTPDLSNVGNQPNKRAPSGMPAQSPFQGVADPISVRKPS